ncbi:ShlB/FhaC/HecB family hemolysin secretion/activation protein, partial [Sodalis-like symbiont of Bactericera trigonica]
MLHHTLAWRRAAPAQELYLSLDYGEMRDGADTGTPRWRRLAGAAVGVRGKLPRANLSYDLLAGLPLSTSAAGATPVFLGFRLVWHY